MGIVLKKGQKVDLTKGNASLKKVIIGLGWDVNKYDGGHDFDLDAVAFCCGDDGKVHNEADMIFYNNLKHSSGAIEHLGDNLTGDGDGDDEQILINLASIPEHITKIDFTVTIHEAEERKQNFGQVSNAYVRVVNSNTKEELIKYDLGEDFSIETAIVVAQLYKNGIEWKFNAIGSGFEGGLASLCKNFGLNV
ncbi:chemical-damaging agent resistance protein C [Clostridium sp. MF28]|uniref:TerD family protein n=1 Tax=Clostridium TaxID=1485 RepID=UPI000CF86146|nr:MULTISPECIES: TerD family protein [Clostridium]AVK47525.1 chemical-damaging agent resistance protein C [Clostridium sp. MF28]PSM58696.1 chemical-damaging agent resistance protein C [Clostridium diolis]